MDDLLMKNENIKFEYNNEKNENSFNNLSIHWSLIKIFNLFITIFKYLFLIILTIFLSNYILKLFPSLIDGSKIDLPEERNEIFTLNKSSYDFDWLERILDKNARNEIGLIFKGADIFKNLSRNKKDKSNFSNMIFFGPPGTGKSHSARLLAENISSHYIVIGGGSLQQLYVGSGAKKWLSIVDYAKKKAKEVLSEKPVVIIVEEIDSLAGKGKHLEFGSKDDTLINTFLESVDSISRDNYNILIIGTTNTIEHIEEAAKRLGRFQNVYFGYSNDLETTDLLIDLVKEDLKKDYFIFESAESASQCTLISNQQKKNVVIIEDLYWSSFKSFLFEEKAKERDWKFDFSFPDIIHVVKRKIIEKSISSFSDSNTITLSEYDAFISVEYLVEYKNNQFKNSSNSSKWRI
ncbi:MAG: ATP-dependent zinc metalloprotease FtsH [Mycoplasmataceae bacterium]|nr:MAG: ATP-dependent zinc metalloprotease FtsH [Mycoplasmataceae bacterium]